jgi:hypothetical protein
MTIRSYAIDNVNNRSQATDDATSTKVPYIDLSGPTLKHNFFGPVSVSSDTVYISSKTKIQLKAFDNESGVNNIQYKIDGNGPEVYNTPFSIDREGIHVIEYTGADNVDNTNTNSFKVMVDNTGPVIYPRFSTTPKGSLPEEGKNIEIYPGHVGLFLAATDVESGYDHMSIVLNGAKEKPIAGFVNGFSKKNELIIKAYDKLGNETIAKIEFAVQN